MHSRNANQIYNVENKNKKTKVNRSIKYFDKLLKWYFCDVGKSPGKVNRTVIEMFW